MIEIEDIVIDPTLVSFAGLSENSKSFCRSLVLHYKGKVHRKKKKKLTNVSFALTPTYVQ